MKISKYFRLFNINDNTILYSWHTDSFINMKSDQKILFNEICNMKKNQQINDYDKDFIRLLAKNRVLFPDNINEIELVYSKRNQIIQDSADKRIITIVINKDCNCRCSYCYENKSSDDYLDKYKAIQKIKQIIRLGGSKCNHIMLRWFGGEPLLSIKEIEFITDQIRKDEPHISINSCMATNGILLSKRINEVMKANNITNIQITIDGTKSIHNKIRSVNNEYIDSYTTILNNLEAYLRHNRENRVYLRFHLHTKRNIKEQIESFKAVCKRFIKYRKRISYYCNLLFPSNIDKWAKTDDDIDSKLVIDDFHLWLTKNNYCYEFDKIGRFFHCDADLPSHIVICSNGELSSCTVTQENYKENVLETFGDDIIKENFEECNDCPELVYCWLGCKHKREKESGSSCCLSEMEKANLPDQTIRKLMLKYSASLVPND